MPGGTEYNKQEQFSTYEIHFGSTSENNLVKIHRNTWTGIGIVFIPSKFVDKCRINTARNEFTKTRPRSCFFRCCVVNFQDKCCLNREACTYKMYVVHLGTFDGQKLKLLLRIYAVVM
jgi:hypothetical protein